MSNAQEFRPGELVDIAIRARIAIRHSSTDGRRIWIEVAGGDYCLPSDDSVTVERVAPPEWPPRAGDLWRDKHGDLWFIHEDHREGRAGALMGRTSDGLRWTDDVPGLTEDNSPLALVRREPECGAS